MGAVSPARGQCGGLLCGLGSVSPAWGQLRLLGGEYTGQSYRVTLEGGCPGPSSFHQDPGPWAEGVKGHVSALRTDWEGRPTKGQQGAVQSFLSVHSPQIWFCLRQRLKCCTLKTLFYSVYCSCQMPIFYTIYILGNASVNRRKRKETFSDGYHVLLIPKGSQAETDLGAGHAQSLLWGHYTA